MTRKLNTPLHAVDHFIPPGQVSSTSKSWQSYVGSSRTRQYLAGAFASILICAALLLLGAVRAQDTRLEADGEAARPQGSRDSVPDPGPEFGPNADKDLDKPHLLAGSYYSLRDGLTATLLLNNKGPRPLEVRPTLFSLAGEPMEIPPVAVEANSFRMIDLREWAALGGQSFEEGSIQLFHLGRDLVLGAQVYLVDDAHSLSFEEKLTEVTDGGGPSRLEGVWWLPPGGADVRLALSNSSDAPLTVTTRSAGVGRAGTDGATINLGPHETRVVDVRQGLQNVNAAESGAPSGGVVRRAGVGAVSVEHSGTGGPLLARAMVQDPTTGYSSTVQFSAPQKGKSSRLEGAGLRLRGASGEPLTPAVVARNVGDAATTLRGRMPYTTAGGDVRFVSIAGVRLSPGEAQIIQFDRAGELSRIPPGATVAGLEFEHAGAPGSVIMAAHSMSDDGNQVYRVPMWDPLAQRSPTGGYPWYIEGDSSTTVYIKNLTRREQKYLAHLVFPGGTYVFGLKSIKGGQTVEIDLRALRDNQTPDEEGRTIPPEVSSGQIKWSLKPAAEPRVNHPYESLALIGRSEQTDTARGISSNYSCQNCCTDGFLYGYIFPDGIELETGEQAQLTAYDVSQDCYGFPITSQASASWSSSNTGVVSVNGGVVTANGIGDVTITAKWYVTEHHEDPTCGGGGTFFAATGGEARQDSVAPSPAGGGDEIVIMAAPGCVNGCGSRYYRNSTGAAVSVKPKVTINSAQTVKDGETANFSVTVQGGTATAYLWTFEAPSDAGNNPNVPFSSTTIHNPTAKAHWFAKPDGDCTAVCKSQYKIKCKVTFTGGKTVTKETSLTVDGCWVPAGQVNPNTARVVGAPQQIQGADGVWRVGNMGTLRRQLPTKEVFVPSTSQFFAKTDAHEEEHIKHWAVGDLLGDVHDPAVFYARIQNVTGTSQMDLIEKLSAELTTYTNEQGAIYESRRVESERRAHAVSDPIAPLYLYNNCGRY